MEDYQCEFSYQNNTLSNLVKEEVAVKKEKPLEYSEDFLTNSALCNMELNSEEEFLRDIKAEIMESEPDPDKLKISFEELATDFSGNSACGEIDHQHNLIKKQVEKEEFPSTTENHSEHELNLTESDEVDIKFEHVKIEKVEETSESELLFSCEVCKKVFVNEKDLFEHKSEKIDCIELEVDENEWNQDDNLTQDFGVPRTTQNDETMLELTAMEDKKSQRPTRKNSSVHDTEKYQCNTCLKRFTSKSGLTCHERIHTGDKPFQCDVCPKSFVRNAHLLEHKLIHEGVEPFQCKLCPKSFKLPSYLSNHERSHKPEKQYFCQFCPKSYVRNYRLVEHQTTHTGEKPFTCPTCSKSFMRKSYLFKHEKTHTSDKPFKCKICSKSFKLNSYLLDHEDIHKPEKMFSCNLCSQLFLNKSSLCRHRKSHTKEKVI